MLTGISPTGDRYAELPDLCPDTYHIMVRCPQAFVYRTRGSCVVVHNPFCRRHILVEEKMRKRKDINLPENNTPEKIMARGDCNCSCCVAERLFGWTLMLLAILGVVSGILSIIQQWLGGLT